MLATALTAVLQGIDAQPVRVEVESRRGPAEFVLVGLPEASVRESRVRVRSALQGLGVNLWDTFLVVNLSPADVRKTGGSFDLAIATATMAALGDVDSSSLNDTLLLGELSLSGAIRPVRGVLPQLLGARRRGVTKAIVPSENAWEAASVGGIEVRVAADLTQVREHLTGKALLAAPEERAYEPVLTQNLDMSDVRGQPGARRALELSAAGGHHLLMIGPPGGGKTMLARRLPTVMPPLTYEEAVQVSVVHSVAGILPADSGLVRARPFRAPHHTVSDAGLIGGGDPPRPGEVSLAHRGVLFLDELAEFRRSTLEALRQPLEDGELTISRARSQATFPAAPLLVAAMNPCPCGYAGDRSGRCHCGEHRIRAYRSKLSGPLLDRIDIHVNVPSVSVGDLRSLSPGESSQQVRSRVVAARREQRERQRRGETSVEVNGSLTRTDLERVAEPDEQGAALLAQAVDKLGLSARAYTKVLRVARTAADLEGSDGVKVRHVAEAIHARILDRTAGT